MEHAVTQPRPAGRGEHVILYTISGTLVNPKRFRLGNDVFAIADNIVVPVTIRGGVGNDIITGGGGLALLLGGDGDDLLYGGKGRSVLFGGRGKDKLFGADADDVLVGGSTQLDADPDADDDDDAALAAVLAAWGSSNSYTSRVDSIGLLLSDLDDGEVDDLSGGNGRDLFFGTLNDRLLDVKRSGSNRETVL
jgi:Ca2+-binding RTX toxin-like protein